MQIIEPSSARPVPPSATDGQSACGRRPVPPFIYGGRTDSRTAAVSPSAEKRADGRPLRDPGGQHKAPQGVSTRDDPALALYWFEQECLKYAGTADEGW